MQRISVAPHVQVGVSILASGGYGVSRLHWHDSETNPGEVYATFKSWDAGGKRWVADGEVRTVYQTEFDAVREVVAMVDVWREMEVVAAADPPTVVEAK